MALRDLLELIETLQRRISEHRDLLSKSETLTRYALIDPLLRALDWDTEDPAVVAPEYPATGGRADYALLNSAGKPVIMVEAKKLGDPLERATAQGIHYTLQKGVLYFAVTDGQRYDVYETHKPVPLTDKRIVSFNLGNSIAKASRNALAIWRPAVLDGSLEPVPVLNELGETPGEDDTALPPSPQPSGDGYIPLPPAITKLKNESGHHVSRVCLPDNTTIEVQFWWQLLKEVVQWLAHQGHLKEHMCPIGKPGARSCAVNTKPIHPSGKEFVYPKQVGSFYISGHANAAGMLSRAAFVIRSVGMDPSRFRLSLRDNSA